MAMIASNIITVKKFTEKYVANIYPLIMPIKAHGILYSFKCSFKPENDFEYYPLPVLKTNLVLLRSR